jgi:ABC-type uncharacterized transport system permease subunit
MFMIAVAHFIAIVCYAGAAAFAAAPFARPVRAPVRLVIGTLVVGIAAHAAALLLAARLFGQLPVTGFGPALSLAGLMVAATLVAAEVGTREVTLTLVAGPIAAILTTIGAASGFPEAGVVTGAGGAWLVSHIALGFFGVAALATAAAAGAMYLVERRELRSRRFGAVLRLFPPLATLDRVNHVSVLAACLALTVGIALATSYSIAHETVRIPEIIWGITAWLAATGLAFGRLLGGWQARRAAMAAGVVFVVVVALYVAVRLNSASTGAFL